MVFNNLAFFYPVWLFFGHVFFSRCLATLGGFAMHGLQSWIANCTAKEAVQKQNCKPQSSYILYHSSTVDHQINENAVGG